VEGTVVDEAGRPVTGVRVGILPPRCWHLEEGNGAAAAYTVSEGRFCLPCPYAGEVAVQADAGEARAGASEPFAIAPGGRARGVVVRLGGARGGAGEGP